MYLFANFKAYLDFAETNILVSQLLQSKVVATTVADIVLFPSALAFTEVEKALRGTDIGVGIQHITDITSNAATGEIHAAQAAAAGARYVLVGHSERRHTFGESNEAVQVQFFSAIAAGLIPVLCIGETSADLAEGNRTDRIQTQLSILDGIDPEAVYLVAYEPVWAITGSGTGKSCDPAQAEEMHRLIRKEIATYTPNKVPILYGGSVKSENIVSYTSLPSIDGVLVGSASTTLTSFEALLHT